MSGDVLGGGVVVALAAALWLAYLIPVWLRRREYLATERNAVRLQQTLRILAETSELPQAVRYEATARTVAEQQRILRKAEGRVKADARAAAEADARRERAVAEAQRAAAEEAERAALAAIDVERASRAGVAASARDRDAAPRAARSVIAPSAQRRRRRLRRVRATTSAILLAGLLGTIGGVALLATGGTWMLLAASAAVAVASFGMLGRLARVRHRPQAVRPVAVAPVAAQLYDHADDEVVPEARPTWTPQPLPKPLHLSRGTIAASAMASIDAATELRRAAARAEIEERAARLASEVTALRPPVPVSVPAAAAVGHGSAGPSSPVPADPRFAAMGLVDDAAFSSIDLDAALRRRRAVG
ncbi:hypothetical protein G3T36_14580 [Diaminobutyricibacter tongyongensis]|uniref:Large exoprotein n=1 Tax=Leifsonia tongyongensis TaxID=1268043 RepID=A0A6L9Y103_9MICO|nr:hypothetical protein [Diaminobutyricibacter tongyongensis]NEN07087.1 hypothetical protein [Diaminobutyricibacter tongyongensis]